MLIPTETAILRAIHESIRVWMRDFYRDYRLADGFPNKQALRQVLLLRNGIACNFWSDDALKWPAVYMQNQPSEVVAAAVDRCLAEL